MASADFGFRERFLRGTHFATCVDDRVSESSGASRRRRMRPTPSPRPMKIALSLSRQCEATARSERPRHRAMATSRISDEVRRTPESHWRLHALPLVLGLHVVHALARVLVFPDLRSGGFACCRGLRALSWRRRDSPLSETALGGLCCDFESIRTLRTYADDLRVLRFHTSWKPKNYSIF